MIINFYKNRKKVV